MKNILLGILLVALAAVVVNKKTWKHKTFLMIIVGLMVAMMAVSMFVKREGFQTADPCTDTTISFKISGISDVTGFVFDDVFGTDATKTGSGMSGPTAIEIKNMACNRTKIRNNLYLLTYLNSGNCYGLADNRFIKYFNFMITKNTIIFNADVSFKTQLSSNTSLLSAAPITITDAAISQRFGGGGTDFAPLNYAFISRLLAYYMRTRAAATTLNEALDYTGVWLDKLSFWQQQPSKLSTGITTANDIDPRYFWIMRINHILGGLAGLVGNKSLKIKDLQTQNIETPVRDIFIQICGTPAATGSGLVGAGTDNPGFVNVVPGFIWGASDANSDVILRHHRQLAMIMYACFIIKHIGTFTITSDLTLGTVNKGTKTFVAGKTYNDILNDNDCVKPILNSIVRNLEASKILLEENQKLPDSNSIIRGQRYQLDRLFRAYLGDTDKCRQPLQLQSLIDLMNQPVTGTGQEIQVGGYFVNKDHKDIVNAEIMIGGTSRKQFFDTAGTVPNSLSSIGDYMQRIIFKTNLDTNNRSAAATPGTTMPDFRDFFLTSDNTNLPVASRVRRVLAASMNHVGMFKSIFSTETVPYPDNYLNQIAFSEDFSGNFTDWRDPVVMDIPLSTLSTAITTVVGLI